MTIKEKMITNNDKYITFDLGNGNHVMLYGYNPNFAIDYDSKEHLEKITDISIEVINLEEYRDKKNINKVSDQKLLEEMYAEGYAYGWSNIKTLKADTDYNEQDLKEIVLEYLKEQNNGDRSR